MFSRLFRVISSTSSSLKSLYGETKAVIKSEEFRGFVSDMSDGIKALPDEILQASSKFNKQTHIALCKQKFENKLELMLIYYNDPLVQEIIHFFPQSSQELLKRKLLDDVNEAIEEINVSYGLKLNNLESLEHSDWKRMLDELNLEHLSQEEVTELFELPPELDFKFRYLREKFDSLRQSNLTYMDKENLAKEFVSLIEAV